MYRRPVYRPENPDAFAREMIHAHPFGVVTVAGDDGGLHASHIPFLLTSGEGSSIALAGHVARANVVWRHLAGAHDVLCVFSGPHAFISSSWYERDDVATWNYAAVHVHGLARLMGPDELRAHVLEVTRRFEGDAHEGGKPVSSASLEKLVPAIVGFEVVAARVECVLKMSQTKADDEYARVLAGLDERAAPGDEDVARMMRAIRGGE